MTEIIKSETIALLAAALAKAHAEVVPVKKTAANPFFKSKYADLSSIFGEYQRCFPKYGLTVTQIPVGVGKNVGLCTVLLHASGEHIGGTYHPETKDALPQTIGSAITYLRRYGMASICAIPSDDDDDGNAATHHPKEQSLGQPQQPSVKELNDRFTKLCEQMMVAVDVRDEVKNLCRHANPDIWSSIIKTYLGQGGQ